MHTLEEARGGKTKQKKNRISRKPLKGSRKGEKGEKKTG